MRRSPIYPDKIRLSKQLKTCSNKKKQRITLYPGDLVIRELYVKLIIADIMQLEDCTFSYKRLTKQI